MALLNNHIPTFIGNPPSSYWWRRQRSSDRWHDRWKIWRRLFG